MFAGDNDLKLPALYDKLNIKLTIVSSWIPGSGNSKPETWKQKRLKEFKKVKNALEFLWMDVCMMAWKNSDIRNMMSMLLKDEIVRRYCRKQLQSYNDPMGQIF